MLPGTQAVGEKDWCGVESKQQSKHLNPAPALVRLDKFYEKALQGILIHYCLESYLGALYVRFKGSTCCTKGTWGNLMVGEKFFSSSPRNAGVVQVAQADGDQTAREKVTSQCVPLCRLAFVLV